MSKPMSITTSNHGKAVFSYILEVFFGFLLAIGLIPSKALIEMFTETGSHVWGLAMFMGSAVALYAALRAPKATDPTWAMQLEQHALLSNSLVYAVFLWATFSSSVAPSAAGLFFVVTLLGGSVTRAWQIKGDLKRLKEAKAISKTSDELTLAEPEKHE